MTDFEKAIAFVLKWEGGYVDNPADPGGETKFGISKRAYPSFDIKNLTEEQAKAIYRRDYWEKMGCNALAWPMNLVVFDTSVNMGCSKAAEIRVQMEGLMGNDWREYLLYRISHYVKLAAKPSMNQFLRGWLNRVMDLWRTAKE